MRERKEKDFIQNKQKVLFVLNASGTIYRAKIKNKADGTPLLVLKEEKKNFNQRQRLGNF